MEAIKKYVEAWLWSFNYDNSDSMTDYFDRNFYETVDFWDFKEAEPAEAQRADMADFDEQSLKAQQEEEKRREEEYQRYLIEQEESRKAMEARAIIEKAQREEISAHIQVVDIADNEKYIVSGAMVCGHGKENSLEELKESGSEKEESAVVRREVYFTDEKVYSYFCEMFLHDFDFLAGLGGTGTIDKRVTDDNFRQLNKAQRESVKWLLWDCVAVFLNGELKLIVDPEGHNYARYVYIIAGECTKILLQEAEKQEEQEKREEFYIPAKIADQAESIAESAEYTLISVDPWTITATMHHITVAKKAITNYAQYENTLYLEYIEKGKRKTQGQYFHDGNRILIYAGSLPAIPTELTREHISGNMYRVKNAGMSVDGFMVDVFRHYRSLGYAPAINTLQF